MTAMGIYIYSYYLPKAKTHTTTTQSVFSYSFIQQAGIDISSYIYFFT